MPDCPFGHDEVDICDDCLGCRECGNCYCGEDDEFYDDNENEDQGGYW